MYATAHGIHGILLSNRLAGQEAIKPK